MKRLEIPDFLTSLERRIVLSAPKIKGIFMNFKSGAELNPWAPLNVKLTDTEVILRPCFEYEKSVRGSEGIWKSKGVLF